MKAAYIESTGPADNIRYGDLPAPEPTGSQVLVQTAAVAVNPIDTYVRAGLVKVELPKPFVVGCDIAGSVAAVGPGVTRFKVGDRVWGSNQGVQGRQGTFAEFAAIEECWLYPTPATVSDQDMVAISLVGITAHLGVVRDAKLRAGETIFINGGSGGVGSTVIQMAKAIGARVIATAGSEAKMESCRQLGADHALNYRSDDIPAKVRELAPQGVDVWWETTREPDLERTISLLALRGRMIVMAGRDARPQLPIGALYTKDCSIFGFTIFNAPPKHQQAAAGDINHWLTQGKLKAHIDRVLPLAETAQAHRLQEESTIAKTGAVTGKIVLKP